MDREERLPLTYSRVIPAGAHKYTDRCRLAPTNMMARTQNFIYAVRRGVELHACMFGQADPWEWTGFTCVKDFSSFARYYVVTITTYQISSVLRSDNTSGK